MITGIADIAPLLTDELKAGDLIRDLRWPNGVRCAHCDHAEVYELTAPNPKRRQWKCKKCRRKFSVSTNSIFEGSHISLGKWIYAIFLMCSSKKGVSANQLKRELNIHYRSAWFLCHRVREAMTQEPLTSMLGGGGAIVELDETFLGGRRSKNRHRRKPGSTATKKTPVMTLIKREGDVRSVMVPNVRKHTLQNIAKPIVDRSANIITDAHLSYTGLDQHFHSHHTVDHSETYVRGVIFHTNFAESYHSLLKRGIIGTFHHVSDKHLPRYLSEFDWKWNTRKLADGARAIETIKGMPGKRLVYKECKKSAQHLI